MQQVPVAYLVFDVLLRRRRVAAGASSARARREFSMPCWRRREDPRHEVPRVNRRVSNSAMTPAPRTRSVIRAPVFQASTPQELDQLFDAAQARGNEGLMIKDPDVALHSRTAGQIVAEAQTRTGHARRGGHGGRVRPRQAHWSAERLHLRRARWRKAASTSAKRIPA